MFKHDPKDKKKMDLDSLDELISKCEDSMISPFKKKKAEAVIEVDPPESDADEKEEHSDFKDMDMEDLIKMYQEMKDRK